MEEEQRKLLRQEIERQYELVIKIFRRFYLLLILTQHRKGGSRNI